MSLSVNHMMKEVNGDLLKLTSDGHFDVIIHGCNCFCQMGKGIALSIKNQFPEAYEADCQTPKGDRNKLGTYSSATVSIIGHGFTIVNAYTQHHCRGKGVKADYEAIRSVMVKVKQDFTGKRIGFPLIGAGLAGGDWNAISDIITTELTGEDITLVRFTSNG